MRRSFILCAFATTASRRHRMGEVDLAPSRRWRRPWPAPASAGSHLGCTRQHARPDSHRGGPAQTDGMASVTAAAGGPGLAAARAACDRSVVRLPPSGTIGSGAGAGLADDRRVAARPGSAYVGDGANQWRPCTARRGPAVPARGGTGQAGQAGARGRGARGPCARSPKAIGKKRGSRHAAGAADDAATHFGFFALPARTLCGIKRGHAANPGLATSGPGLIEGLLATTDLANCDTRSNNWEDAHHPAPPLHGYATPHHRLPHPAHPAQAGTQSGLGGSGAMSRGFHPPRTRRTTQGAARQKIQAMAGRLSAREERAWFVVPSGLVVVPPFNLFLPGSRLPPGMSGWNGECESLSRGGDLEWIRWRRRRSRFRKRAPDGNWAPPPIAEHKLSRRSWTTSGRDRSRCSAPMSA